MNGYDLSNSVSGIRICLVSPFPPPIGGPSNLFEYLLNCLRSEGIAVEVADTYPHLPLRAERNLLGRFVGFTVQGFLPVTRASVVHIQSRSDWGFWGPVCWPVIWSKMLGKRIVVTFQGGAGDDFFARWGKIALPFLRQADAVIVASEFLRRLLTCFDIQPVVVPNIVDVARFEYREPLHLQPRLVVARHLDPIYNIPCVLRAFRIVQHRFPEAELLLTGRGSQETELRKLVVQLGLQNVLFTGRVPDICDVYRRAHIYVNASLVDNSPVAIVEAFASGLPVVSTRVGDVPYMIEHGVNGWLVDSNDHVGLAEGVTWLVEHPSEASAIRRCARQRAQRYTWTAQRDRLLAVYTGRPVPPESSFA